MGIENLSSHGALCTGREKPIRVPASEPEASDRDLDIRDKGGALRNVHAERKREGSPFKSMRFNNLLFSFSITIADSSRRRFAAQHIGVHFKVIPKSIASSPRQVSTRRSLALKRLVDPARISSFPRRPGVCEAMHLIRALSVVSGSGFGAAAAVGCPATSRFTPVSASRRRSWLNFRVLSAKIPSEGRRAHRLETSKL